MNITIAATVRNVVAVYFGVKASHVTDQVRLRDLGADWLARLEILMMIEDRLPDFRVGDVVVDHIETVGDLIRSLEAAPSRDGLTTERSGS
jgi:acyl carrier protein